MVLYYPNILRSKIANQLSFICIVEILLTQKESTEEYKRNILSGIFYPIFGALIKKTIMG